MTMHFHFTAVLPLIKMLAIAFDRSSTTSPLSIIDSHWRKFHTISRFERETDWVWVQKWSWSLNGLILINLASDIWGPRLDR